MDANVYNKCTYFFVEVGRDFHFPTELSRYCTILVKKNDCFEAKRYKNGQTKTDLAAKLANFF